jgi:hypothetical protein
MYLARRSLFPAPHLTSSATQHRALHGHRRFMIASALKMMNGREEFPISYFLREKHGGD